MIARSKEFWLVGFFLSKYGEKQTNNATLPPSEISAFSWKEAYKSFFKSLGKARTESTFANSLKNARDSFDSHIENSPREGWMDKKRKPALLTSIAKDTFDKYSSKSRSYIWNEIKQYRN